MAILEEAETYQPRVRVVQMSDSPTMRAVRSLLASRGLGLDADIEFFVAAYDGEQLLGCLGLAGNVVKCAATDPSAEGQGVLAPLVERVAIEALDRGRSHLFLSTKPAVRELFEGLGFTLLAEVPDAVLMENTPFGLSQYVAGLRALRLPGDRIGGIVLNANPFTLGHRYLVQRAADAVDALHVFVVGEDAALFPADVRLRLVRRGVAELGLGDRVRVHAGSAYVVSRATFPNYFLAKGTARASAAAGLDLQLFRTAIAPALTITDRFVGSEPLCAVTAAYNAEMRHWLEQAPSPAPAIRVHELPRTEIDGEAVSASRVRAAIAAHDLDAVARLVPTPTLDHIRKRFFDQLRK